MPLSYLIDEHLRGALFVTLMREATRLGFNLNVVQVGDDFGPPLGTKDPDLLLWAEVDQRLLISQDKKTMQKHLSAHLAGGHRCAGILRLRERPLLELANYLLLMAYASDPDEWRNCITNFP